MMIRTWPQAFEIPRSAPLVILAVLAMGHGACSPPPPPPPIFEPLTKILIISVDCMRADHISSYGYSRQTTPAIDAVAADGLRFTRAYAQANWTKPSVASLMSGLYVRHHGVTVGATIMRQDGSVLKGVETFPMPEDFPVLAEVFRDAGFRTAGFIENSNLTPAQGFGRGFEIYGRREPAALHIRRWLEGLDVATERVFGYMHIIGPHDPYSYPMKDGLEGYMERFETTDSTIDSTDLSYKSRRDLTAVDVRRMVGLYDAELAFYDGRQIGQLVDWLKEQGLYDDFLIIITADHGEELYDKGGWAHGHSLFEEVNRVPLIIKFPKNISSAHPSGSTIEETIEQIDLFPTLLELAGLEPIAGLDGKSVADLFLGLRESDPEAFAITEYGRDLPDHIVAASIVQGGQKLVVRYPLDYAPKVAGFTDEDPHVRFYAVENLMDEEIPRRQIGKRALHLRDLLIGELGSDSTIRREMVEAVKLSAAEVEHLKALGYLD